MSSNMMIRNWKDCRLLLCQKSSKFFRSMISVALEKVDRDVVDYPPVKPRLPPGKWGSMDKKECWKWHDLEGELQKMLTVQEKMNLLTEKEFRTWQFDVCQTVPRTYDYQRAVTKTHMANGLPEVYNSHTHSEQVALYMEKLKPLIKDVLLMEHEKLERNKISSKYPEWKIGSIHSSIILKAILQTMHSVIAHEFNHLLFSQLDEYVRVEAFWDRHGIPKHLPKIYNKEQYVRPQHSRLQSKYIADFQIRMDQPLPEFIPRDDRLCCEGEYPEVKYWPTVLGQIAQAQKHSAVAGYNHGDPCEFGLLSVLSMPGIIKMEQNYGLEHANTLLKGYGMAASFVWLVAQAYNQGFNTCQELTYPLTTQTFISDGKKFSFFAYQLNTLQLWKDDDANPLRNFCWHTEPMNLYETIENEEVIGFNDDLLKQLLNCMLLQPSSQHINRKPYLQEDEDRSKKLDFVNLKIDEVSVDEEQVYDES